MPRRTTRLHLEPTSPQWPQVTAVVALGLTVSLLSQATASAAPQLQATTDIGWTELVMGLLGGLSLFLFGMERMGAALQLVAGDRLKDILAALSNNRVIGLITGAVTTAIIQSSSVTTVMLVGFVSAGLITLSQSVAIILGADIGTTITAQIVAFKVTKYALGMIALGFAIFFTARTDRTREYGAAIMGLGLIFFGMETMSHAMHPLRSYQPFLDAMADMSNPVMGILVATAFTALIQSSSATMGVVIVLAMQGVLTLEAGIALALGANIGTCATAALAAIGKPREAVRVAVTHVLFKVAGVLLILPFLDPFAHLVRVLSPGDVATTAEGMAAVVPRQVANAHTFFNVGLAFLFLPFTTYIGRLVTWLVPDRADEKEAAAIEAHHLSPLLFHTPALALDAARRELRRMGDLVLEMLDDIGRAVLSGSREQLEAIAARDEQVDALYGQIVSYLGEISKLSISQRQSEELMRLFSALNDLENIGDVIETNLVRLGLSRIEEGVEVSTETQEVLLSLAAVVREAVERACRAVADQDVGLARRVTDVKPDVNRLVEIAEAHQAKRLIAPKDKRVTAYTIEVDIIDKLKRIYYHAKRMAKTVTALELSAATTTDSEDAA